MNIKKGITGIFCLLLLIGGTRGAHTDSSILNNYIEMGLKSNLALKQQHFLLEKSLQALREAKGMFLPSITIEARYSRAGGGRVIEMPTGDLVNPIHMTLNQLLTAQGLTPAFPANIQNEYIPFLRKSEHETKLRITQPIFQPPIYYNLKIKKDLTRIQEAKLKVYKRQLVEEIKKAYYNYLKTLKVKELFDDTLKLLEENLRISESLFHNHKVTEEVVFRSKAELSSLQKKIAEAEKNIHLSASYFNFLLNRPLETDIQIKTDFESPVFKEYNLEVITNNALSHREEFEQLQGAIKAAHHTSNLHKASILPTISAVFDYGFQGEKYSFTGDDDYWMGSLVMSWNLFKGGQDMAKKKQAQYEVKRIQAQTHELENQIRLQVNEAYENLAVAKKTIISSIDSLKSQKEAFFIISKKYEEGMVPQIEHIKAQNDYTSARIAKVIAIFDYYIKEAQLERITAVRNLDFIHIEKGNKERIQ